MCDGEVTYQLKTPLVQYYMCIVAYYNMFLSLQ